MEFNGRCFFETPTNKLNLLETEFLKFLKKVILKSKAFENSV